MEYLTSGLGNERTFQYDDDLPPLPVPPLQQTLFKYLESVRPFLTDEQFKNTERIVGEFRHGLGQTLHEKLLERSKKEKNWLHQWWEDMYLEIRFPLGVLQNISGMITTQDSVWPPEEGTQLKRAAIFFWYQLYIYLLVRKEKIPVEKNRNGSKIFSMDQYRRTYHCCREPGIERDSICTYFKTEREGPCPTHVHVMCNGHIFKMIPFDKKGELLTAPEMHRQLEYIKERSKEKGQCIGALTAADRATFATALEHLYSLDPVNRSHVEAIKSSILGFTLDPGCPKNNKEACIQGVAGPYPYNRWFDKSSGTIITENGIISNSADHAAYDAMASVITSTFIFLQLQKDGGGWPFDQGSAVVRSDIPMPTELIFTIDEKVLEDIEHATDVYTTLASNFEVGCITYTGYGKDYLKEHGMHADTTVQLALQLAYFTEYGRPGAAYETATTRQFYRGRTETVRSCTMEVIDWCRAMHDPDAQPSYQMSLFRKAHAKHLTLMAEATNGQGLDRHLFGLYNIAQEMGLPVPELYTDEAYTLSGGGGNFPLSTSTVGSTPILGSMSPMKHDGYMCCYRFGNSEMHVTASAFKNCAETDPDRLLRQVVLALDKIATLVLSSKI